MPFALKQENEILETAGRDGIEKVVVGAIISRGREVLILRRKPADYLGGLDELPSGHVEPGESVMEALCREVEEETGLQVSRVRRMVDFFDYLTGSSRKARQLNFAVDVENDEAEIILSEHSSYCWVGREGGKDLNLTDEVKNTLSQHWDESGTLLSQKQAEPSR